MHDDVRSKEPASATMSRVRTQQQLDLTESEYLQRQAEDARRAIGETLANMRATLKDAGDIKAWARQYPWPSVGAAAAIGFLAASVLAPGTKSNAKSDSLLERILADDEIAARLKELSTADSSPRWPMLNSMFSSLLKNLGGTLQSALIAAIAASAQSASDNSASENGHSEPEPESENTAGEPI